MKDKKLFKVSGNREQLDKEGVGNVYFYTKLCEDRDLLLEFLKEVGLIQFNLKCEKYGG